MHQNRLPSNAAWEALHYAIFGKGQHFSCNYRPNRISAAFRPEELQYTLYILETKGFKGKVRIKERYEVNENVRQSQEIDFFFFASSAQVRLARHSWFTLIR